MKRWTLLAHLAGVQLALLVFSGCDSPARAPLPIPVPSPELPPGDGLLGSLELQEVVALQLRRDGPALVVRLVSSDAAVRARAALALGSVQDAGADKPLRGLLKDPDARVRANAAFALGQLPVGDIGDALWLALESESDLEARRRLIEAIGKRGGIVQVVSLLRRGPDDGLEVPWTLALARGGIRGVRGDEFIEALTERLRDPDPEVRLAAAYYFGSAGTPGPWILQAPRVREALDAYEPDDAAAMYLVQGLSLIGNVETDRERMAYWLANGADWRVRVAVVDALQNGPWLSDALVQEALFAALDDASGHVRVAAASVAGMLIWNSPDHLARAAALMNGPEEEWRTQAAFVPALVSNGFAELVRSWTRRMAQLHPLAARAGIEGLADADGPEVTAFLFDLAGHSEPIVRAAAVSVLSVRWPQEGSREAAAQRYFDLFRERLRDAANLPAARAARALANSVFDALGAPALLQEVYREQRPSADMNRLAPLLDAMGESSLPFLREALSDPDYRVRQEAALVVARTTGEAVDPAQLRLPSPEPSVDWSALAQLGPEPRVEVETDRGTMVVRLFPDQAPLTVQSFIEQVRAGSQDGVAFHRVVPNFVIQGGDFGLGDGTGNPGYRLRSEFTELSFRRGVLGMASSGKDTEGSQFFLTHSDQPGMDGEYTAFGWLESGSDVLDLIQEGDRVIEMRVLPSGP
ncbi:MAG: peptidylprolyl isomerase [Gemmatimonadetes bacterium]|nr:peptidylprolyl isomerase [Gemmatimonadota bacterium]